jgi:pimeloyl-ACP methyl ester carboxylesterase
VRFVIAIVSFVVAAVMIGAGIAQQTIFRAPDRVRAMVAVESSAPVTVIDGATLNSYPRQQRIDIAGSERIFAAYGRTTDVLAWIGDTSYNTLSLDAESGVLSSDVVNGASDEVPDPAGSDLWLAEYSDDNELSISTKVPPPSKEDISFLVVSTGTDPAPADIQLSWPIANNPKWVGPLLLGGAIALIVGLGMLLWAILHMRASRGPRRGRPKMPKLPKPPRYKPSKHPKAIVAGRRGRRSARVTMVAAPLALLGVVALGGCSGASTAYSPSAAPGGSVSDGMTLAAETDELGGEPAVTQLQAERIVQRVSETAATADKKFDAKLAEERFAGPALAVRKADYVVRKIDPKAESLVTIPAGPLEVILPQRKETWPRTVFTVVRTSADNSTAPLALMLIQDDPRANYKVHYAFPLVPGETLPAVAEPDAGALRLGADTPFLSFQPDQLATAYGDILLNDTESEFYDAFDATNDPFRDQVGAAAKKKERKALPDTVKLAFRSAAGPGETIVFATVNGGAIVAVELHETEEITPVEEGASISTPKDIKALSGKASTTKGITATYADQLLFYVPSTTEGGPVKLLGYESDLVTATEVKE